MHYRCGRFVVSNVVGMLETSLVRKTLQLYRDSKDGRTHSCIHQLTNAVACNISRGAYGLMCMQALLTVEQLAECLRKSVASIRSDATRNPQSLPPLCRLPGTKRLLWRVEDVERWLGTHVSSSAATIEDEPTPNLRRRGRPTKAEQVRRQLENHNEPSTRRSAY